ncbi:tungstate transport system permease protein [Caldicellulosiruptor bescii]|uniref:Binding-protein-dependent transport systems inner membrane component n=2 Tax=Caldicellulosiruptor bescii TaxID=31899 RepID=B9MQI6_CALBD|nr:ABC transporter permease [Caldicellulosiruptor bescii]ACM59940.1 binding-protein-dependent transport systems inner membrane component [Caldicellulosiruptor bescii DSM 6725]PBC87351.1 tungstate transport system permease protein [Caldicellulosiruptor bescii]PBC90291.1 tungstate transport system permease protein [Caldicellulosiruptor bescii]PBD04281.1 tungstate transport system permease protein [Caldicellulosiruptor bescii]PBD06088.1 tungstate transport system permease protein [Caldicellulosir
MLANVVLSTLVVCIPSTLLAVLIGVFAGYFIKVKRFKYRKVLIRIVYTLSGLPPVLAGLLIYILLSRKGPLGFLDMLFTKWAMIITQVILIVPIVMLYTLSGLKNIDRVLENLDYLNIKGRKRYTAIMKEYSKEIMYAIVLGLSRSISEVGGVLIVGGNIEGSTRILTTAIIFEITKGEFSNALMLGLVLLAISFTFNTILQILQGDVFD